MPPSWASEPLHRTSSSPGPGCLHPYPILQDTLHLWLSCRPTSHSICLSLDSLHSRRISGPAQLPSKAWLLPECFLVLDRDTIFLGHCFTVKLSSGTEAKTSFSISVCLRTLNDCSLCSFVFVHVALGLFTEGAKHKTPMRRWSLAWTSMEPSRPGLALPRDLECLEGLSIHPTPPTIYHFSPSLVEEHSILNEAGRGFIEKGEERTCSQGLDSVERIGLELCWSSW